MKFSTFKLLLISSTLICSFALAQEKVAQQHKQTQNIVNEELKCGPLADFYELVAQRPSNKIQMSSMAKMVSDISQSPKSARTSAQIMDEPKALKVD